MCLIIMNLNLFDDYRGGKPDDVTVLVAQIILGDSSDKGTKVEG